MEIEETISKKNIYSARLTKEEAEFIRAQDNTGLESFTHGLRVMMMKVGFISKDCNTVDELNS